MSIKVTDLSYSYDSGKTFAVKCVSNVIESKEFLAIIGHTGSGKSTFIQNLNALLLPTLGSVTVDEYVIKNKVKIKNIKELRKKIGIVFQFPEYQLFEETVEKDILFGPRNFKLISKDDHDENKLAKEVLEIVGLDESFLKKSPFELSGGEKRRVAIAGILAFNPDVLIVDEPTAGLDPNATANMMDLFKKLNDMGKTTILVTHQMDHVLKYADRALVFQNGELKCDKTPIELFNDLNLIKSLGIDVPSVINLTHTLSKKYPKLLDYKIKTIDDFIKAYKEVIAL